MRYIGYSPDMRNEGFWYDPSSGFWASYGRGRWGRHARRFRRGWLKYILLKLLADLPRHGYDLIRAVREKGWAAGPGSVYPILGALERAGWVEGVEEEGRRTYKVTEKGKRILEEHLDEIAGFFSEKGEENGEAEPGEPLRDALARLVKAVTQIGESSKPETIDRARELLDNVRKEIYTLLAQE
jgi:DNA-binding PadR family transcriptional regulator